MAEDFKDTFRRYIPKSELEAFKADLAARALELERLRTVMAYPIVVDGRNLYEPAKMSAAGFSYYSIGRSAVLTERKVEAVSLGAVGGSPRPDYAPGDIRGPAAAWDALSQ